MKSLWMLAAMAAVSPAFAGIAPPPDDFGDVFVNIVNGQLRTSAITDLGNGEFSTAFAQCFSAEFGEANIPNFADDPGFYSNELPGGFTLSFNFLDAARVWNGADFSSVYAPGITASAALGVPGAPTVVTPASGGGFQSGFEFVTADGTGFIDEHVDLLVNDPAPASVYLLTLDLTGPGVVSSPRFFFVMNNGASEAEFAAAKAYVQEFIVPAPGAAAVLGLAGLACVRRRR